MWAEIRTDRTRKSGLPFRRVPWLDNQSMNIRHRVKIHEIHDSDSYVVFL